MSAPAELDPKGLEAAEEAIHILAHPDSPQDEMVKAVLAAYFGAVEAVGWITERNTRQGTAWFIRPMRTREKAAAFARERVDRESTGRIRALYPGPIQESSDG